MSTRGTYLQAGQFHPIDAYGKYSFEDTALKFNIGTTGSDWILSQHNSSGTAVLADRAGGWIRMDAGATTADRGPQLQKAGEFVLPAAGKKHRIQVEMDFSANVGNQFFFGYVTEDTAVFASGENNIANHIGFEMNATTVAANPGVALFVSEKAGTRTSVAAAHTFVAGTAVLLEIQIDGLDKIEAFVNGALVATITTNIPIVEMTPTIFVNAEGTTRPTVDFRFIRGDGDL